MSEVAKAVGQWIVSNLGWSVVIFLFILSCLFKITKKEIDPLGWVLGWFGKALTKDVRKDISEFKTETHEKFEEVKHDRATKIEELKNDYDKKISALREDLDSFEKRTDSGINEMKMGTVKNCEQLKKRMDEMETSQQRSNDMQTVMQIKAHVLDFANSCMNHRRHTKRDFENIIEENTLYESLVEKYKLKNDVYKDDYNYILEVYHKCRAQGSFLNENPEDT